MCPVKARDSGKAKTQTPSSASGAVPLSRFAPPQRQLHGTHPSSLLLPGAISTLGSIKGQALQLTEASAADVDSKAKAGLSAFAVAKLPILREMSKEAPHAANSKQSEEALLPQPSALGEGSEHNVGQPEEGLLPTASRKDIPAAAAAPTFRFGSDSLTNRDEDSGKTGLPQTLQDANVPQTAAASASVVQPRIAEEGLSMRGISMPYAQADCSGTELTETAQQLQSVLPPVASQISAPRERALDPCTRKGAHELKGLDQSHPAHGFVEGRSLTDGSIGHTCCRHFFEGDGRIAGVSVAH